MEQLISCDAGEEEVGAAVIVVIAHGHTHAVAGACHARFFRYVGERAVAVVVEQAIPVRRRCFLERRDLAPFTR